MTLDASAALGALATLIEGVVGAGNVYRGVPEAVSGRLSAYVALVGWETADAHAGELSVRLTFRVVFAYRIGDDDAAGEAALLVAAGAFTRAFFANRNLGGTWRKGKIDPSPQGEPRYAPVAGQQYRELPLDVGGEQAEPYDNVGQP